MSSKKILIVDDEDDLLKILDKRLTMAGYCVIKANNGEDAIEYAGRERPSLILLDVNMPDMDGGQVGEILKNAPNTKHIPILFLTGMVTHDEQRKTGHSLIGGNFVIAKPFKSEDLIRQIEKLIGQD
jgi:CheY-like chemotaxis protein